MADVSLFSRIHKVPESSFFSCSLLALGAALTILAMPGSSYAQETPDATAQSENRPDRPINGAMNNRAMNDQGSAWGERSGHGDARQGWTGRTDQNASQATPATSVSAEPVQPPAPAQTSAPVPSWNGGGDWRSRTAQSGQLRQEIPESRDDASRRAGHGGRYGSPNGWQGEPQRGWRNREQPEQQNNGWTTPIPNTSAAQSTEPNTNWASRSAENSGTWNSPSAGRNGTYADPNRNRTYTDPDRNSSYRDRNRERERGEDRNSWEGNRGQNNPWSGSGAWGGRSRDWNANRDHDGDRYRNRDWRGNTSWNGNYGQRGWNNQWRGNNYRNGYHDSRSWDRDWRRSSRYDWYGYRDQNRNIFRMGRYYSPYRNYSYRRLSIGIYLNSLFFGSDYIIDDPWRYRLPDTYGPYRWIRYYDDALLIDTYSGQVVDVVYDFFY